MEEDLLSISPIDGRYKENTEEVRKCFSEYHLIKNRIIVKIQWLKKLFAIKEIGLEIEGKELNILEKIAKEFDIKGKFIIKETV